MKFLFLMFLISCMNSSSTGGGPSFVVPEDENIRSQVQSQPVVVQKVAGSDDNDDVSSVASSTSSIHEIDFEADPSYQKYRSSDTLKNEKAKYAALFFPKSASEYAAPAVDENGYTNPQKTKYTNVVEPQSVAQPDDTYDMPEANEASSATSTLPIIEDDVITSSSSASVSASELVDNQSDGAISIYDNGDNDDNSYASSSSIVSTPSQASQASSNHSVDPVTIVSDNASSDDEGNVMIPMVADDPATVTVAADPSAVVADPASPAVMPAAVPAKGKKQKGKMAKAEKTEEELNAEQKEKDALKAKKKKKRKKIGKTVLKVAAGAGVVVAIGAGAFVLLKNLLTPSRSPSIPTMPPIGGGGGGGMMPIPIPLGMPMVGPVAPPAGTSAGYAAPFDKNASGADMIWEDESGSGSMVIEEMPRCRATITNHYQTVGNDGDVSEEDVDVSTISTYADEVNNIWGEVIGSLESGVSTGARDSIRSSLRERGTTEDRLEGETQVVYATMVAALRASGRGPAPPIPKNRKRQAPQLNPRSDSLPSYEQSEEMEHAKAFAIVSIPNTEDDDYVTSPWATMNLEDKCSRNSEYATCGGGGSSYSITKQELMEIYAQPQELVMYAALLRRDANGYTIPGLSTSAVDSEEPLYVNVGDMYSDDHYTDTLSGYTNGSAYAATIEYGNTLQAHQDLYGAPGTLKVRPGILKAMAAISVIELTYDALKNVILFIVRDDSMAMFNYAEQEIYLKPIKKKNGYRLYYCAEYNVSVLSRVSDKGEEGEKLSVYILPNESGDPFIPHKIQARPSEDEDDEGVYKTSLSCPVRDPQLQQELQELLDDMQ